VRLGRQQGRSRLPVGLICLAWDVALSGTSTRARRARRRADAKIAAETDSPYDAGAASDALGCRLRGRVDEERALGQAVTADAIAGGGVAATLAVLPGDLEVSLGRYEEGAFHALYVSTTIRVHRVTRSATP